MAFHKCKGVVLKLEISSTLTAIAQIIGIDVPEDEAEDFEVKTLDQAGVGVGREMTGFTDSGGFAVELFYDNALSSQAAFRTNHIVAPAKSTWQISAMGGVTIDFICAGCKWKPKIAAGDGLKADLSGNLDGLPTYS